MVQVVGYTRGGRVWVPRFLESIDAERCIGCGRCYKACSRNVLELIDNPFEKEDEFGDDMGNKVMYVANPEDCIGCGSCSRVCTKKCHKHITL
ncbi:ferredoxin III, nif-specific [Candidatus Magnetobacterium casense]|uniref:Ferredoxin III, nif-specific n=1 Tax=Candidatus Magnetobacterium casense TaxID=1455061 RepID=A0ABS6S019_9BACT|nr:ferredoxin III, nif-specific [Candidatus Magnetobacterium casensis]MBV6342146.1 ferredoxin III, nif-specific [Candidatus Magnetobacterium casensis]